jgi:hypothetical protein
MERVRFITHKGKQVLLLDYRDIASEQEMLVMIEDRKDIVAAQPKGSVLTVADITGAKFTRNEVERIKEANVYDLPYVKRAAVVGVDESHKAVVDAVESFAHRGQKQFATLAEALDWLVADEKAG